MTRHLAAKKLSQLEYSVLHLHTYILGLLSVNLMKELPTVVSLDMTAFQVAQQADPSFIWTHSSNIFLGKRVFNAAAKIVTRSEWARKSVIEDYRIDEEKVTVVYPGVNINKLRPLNTSKRDILKRYNILFVGNDFERKGGQDVLEVFLNTFSHNSDLHLVTNAPVECELPNVYIHRNVKAYSPKWLELYQQADIFVMPTYFEGFGWVFIEAMAAGLPVIATRINAIPEIVNHGETGFLIQPGDRNGLACCLRELMENRTLRQRMGTKGRKVVEQKFNAQTHCQILEEVFQEASLLK